MTSYEPGLYLVSTPIGNLKDITLRALEVLKTCDHLACEDTRRSRILLNHYGISKPLTSFREENKRTQTPILLSRIARGERVALICDAGTPGISDPGFYLIREAIRQGFRVVPIPGPSAILTALVASGLPSDRFCFEGFLPRRAGRRRKRLKELASEPRTVILYESPHRLLRTLKELLEVMGEREVVLARELTKRFEEFRRGPISQLLAEVEEEGVKGELVLLLGRAQKRLKGAHI